MGRIRTYKYKKNKMILILALCLLEALNLLNKSARSHVMKKIANIMLSVAALLVTVTGSAFATPPPPLPAPVPEPGTIVLLGLGVAGFALYKKIKK